MSITIITVPYSEMRYPTAGDWVWVDETNLQIRVADVGNRKYEALVAVHELVEALLCQAHGITTAEVDAFDKAFGDDGEPGDHPDAPYRKEHFFATSIERLLAAELGVDWLDYDEAIIAL